MLLQRFSLFHHREIIWNVAFFLKDKEKKLILLLFHGLRFRTFWRLPDAVQRGLQDGDPVVAPSLASLSSDFSQRVLDEAEPHYPASPSDKSTTREEFSARAGSSRFPKREMLSSFYNLQRKGEQSASWRKGTGLRKERGSGGTQGLRLLL